MMEGFSKFHFKMAATDLGQKAGGQKYDSGAARPGMLVDAPETVAEAYRGTDYLRRRGSADVKRDRVIMVATRQQHARVRWHAGVSLHEPHLRAVPAVPHHS